MKREVAKVSNDSDALRKFLELDLTTKTARWEVFGTPEHTGGVPGPTDFITLIAEVVPSDQKLGMRPTTGKVWIAPESARPWLTEGFQSMLASHRNTSTNLSIQFNCRKFQSRLKKSGEPVEGFICNGAEKIFHLSDAIGLLSILINLTL